MKRTFLSIVAIVYAVCLTAQDQTVNGELTVTEKVRWGTTGAVLNTDQGASVELRGTGVPYFDFSNDATTDYDMRMILRGNDLLSIEGGNLQTSNNLVWGSAGARLQTDQGASIELRGTGVPYFDFSNDATTDYDMRLILTDNNTLSVTGGNLAVNGAVITKEVEVKPNVWADFVFEKNYSLPALKEVKNHIDTHGHLKDIPSAKEVEENGISLGQMDAKLLQKIEELTLYTIHQEEKIEELTLFIDQQNKKMEELGSLLDTILNKTDKN